jgi:hypothetical protein
MSTTTAAGTAIAISAGYPMAQSIFGYSGLAYVEIAGVEQIGTIGANTSKAEFQPLKGPKQKRKGSTDYGSLQPTIALDSADAGQALLRVAAEPSNSALYAVRVTYPDRSKRYFQARVFGFPESVGNADSMITVTPTIEINTAVIRALSSDSDDTPSDPVQTIEFSPNAFEGATQTARIKNALAAMKAAVGLPTQLNLALDTATIPNTSKWVITEAIQLGDNMTLLLNGSTLKSADGVFDNVIRNDGIKPDPANPNGKVLSVTQNKNIKIIGINGAKIEGPDVPYSAPHPVNGGTAVPWVGDDYGWRTCNITMTNVDGLEISGFTSDKPRAWSITLSHGVKNFYIHDLAVKSAVPNGDGIDVRNGCSAGRIERIVGDTQDDIVAVCAAVPFEDGSPYPMIPLGYASNPLGDDTFDIVIDGVSGHAHSGNNVRAFTSGQLGTSLHDITIRNIHQTGGDKCVNIGTFSTYVPAVGALRNITVDNVVADSAPIAVQITAVLQDAQFSNVQAKANYAAAYSWSNAVRDGSVRTTFTNITNGPIPVPAAPGNGLDPVLTNGSIFLGDMSHPNNPAAIVGAPTDSMAIPNIAFNEAIVLAGGNSAAEWNGRVGTNLVTTGATPEAKLERSAKGGLHVIMSRANDADGHGLFVGERGKSTRLTQYISANPTHRYGLWVWERCTLLETATDSINSIIYSAAGGAGDILVKQSRYQNNGNSVASNANPALPQPVGNRRWGLAATGFSQAAPTASPDVCAHLWNIGNMVNGSASLHKSRSAILYRIYLEDLTVSGRDFATVDALDAAQWSAATGTGGRYEAATETFTNPATLA